MSLQWKVDECSVYFDRLHLCGWCFNSASPIVSVTVVFPEPPTRVAVGDIRKPSPDVAAAVNAAATHCRFDEWLFAPSIALGQDFALHFALDDGSVVIAESALGNAIAGDPYFASFGHFLEHLHKLPGGTLLEIGSRARSALVRRNHIPRHIDYVGLDILEGPNVDVVGDAHRLEELFGRHRFIAAMSFSVFEHLAMPWKVALELNHVLKLGGVVFTQSVQTWPVHEEPWDFWRFSNHSWRILFNSRTGFEVLQAVCGDPARIHAIHTNPATHGLAGSRQAFLGSSSIVRKISDTDLIWPISVGEVASGQYPSGEMAVGPCSSTVPFRRA